MADLANSEEPACPLLDIAREIRDTIFHHCVRDFSITGDCEALLVQLEAGWAGPGSESDFADYDGLFRIKNGPYPAILLTCRQIYHEYRDVIKQTTTLVLYDTFPEFDNVPWLRPSMRFITRLEVLGGRICEGCTGEYPCDDAEEYNASQMRAMEEQWMSVRLFPQAMPNLKSFYVRLDIMWPPGVLSKTSAAKWLDDGCGGLCGTMNFDFMSTTEIKNVTSVEVYRTQVIKSKTASKAGFTLVDTRDADDINDDDDDDEEGGGLYTSQRP